MFTIFLKLHRVPSSFNTTVISVVSSYQHSSWWHHHLERHNPTAGRITARTLRNSPQSSGCSGKTTTSWPKSCHIWCRFMSLVMGKLHGDHKFMCCNSWGSIYACMDIPASYLVRNRHVPHHLFPQRVNQEFHAKRCSQ